MRWRISPAAALVNVTTSMFSIGSLAHELHRCAPPARPSCPSLRRRADDQAVPRSAMASFPATLLGAVNLQTHQK